MNTEQKTRIPAANYYMPSWMIVGTAVILLVVVVVLAVRNIHREKHYMSQILSEKGAALIKAFEAGARTGMMATMWGGSQVQTLLEETARQPGILYLVVTDDKGLILAHSDKSQVGNRFMDTSTLATLRAATTVQWRLRALRPGQRAFEVYRLFRPLGTRGAFRGGTTPGRWCPSPGRMPRKQDWCFPENPSTERRVIFVGLDVAPFEAARREDIRNTVLISVVLVVLGLGGFWSMFLAQRYRTTKGLLQDTSAFTEEVVTHLPVGLIATGRDGRIAVFNETAEVLTGLCFKDCHGHEPAQILPSLWMSIQEQVRKGIPVIEKEMSCRFSGEKPVPVSVSASRIVNEEGDFVGDVIILRDLGEVRSLQEEIRRQEKLAALGHLAAGVAHEIRNPLSSIKGLATYFGQKFEAGTPDRESARVMVQEVDRLNRAVSELLEFARPPGVNPRATDVKKLLQHSLLLVQQDAMARNIKLDLSVSDETAQVCVDPERFSQALLNLYLNAIHAMSKGGVMSVKVSPGRSGYIEIEIADTGQGIAPADVEKIFDPYYTTKPGGTGIGLAIVHKIVEAHGGRIKVKSKPGKGTIFTIQIPNRQGDGGKCNADES
ncbi:MAG: PAS domain-containing protein [Deltaproteobacteria bacterium]|nr:PAS domain-containing protein [Deltaproteobacteria bacterium]